MRRTRAGQTHGVACVIQGRRHNRFRVLPIHHVDTLHYLHLLVNTKNMM